MKNYAYNAVDYSGKTIKGTIQSASVETAFRDLGANGLYIVSISERVDYFSKFKNPLQSFRVGSSDIVEFAQGFSIMINSGVPILSCLDDIIDTTTNPAFVPILKDVRQRLERGSTISQALDAHGNLFPEILKTLVAVGEETGSLVEGLREAAEHLQKMQRLNDGVKKALMYPAFAFTATIGALAFWMVFVIPGLTSTLKGLGVKLPMLTLALIKTSSLFQAHWGKMILAACLVPVPLYLLNKHPKIRYYVDRAIIKMPLLRIIVFNKLLSVFSEQFRMLLNAGINMGRIFDLIIPSLGNEYFAVNLRQIKENILNGGRISDAFEQQKILPPLAVGKIRIGETTGTLDNQFGFLAKYYSKKLDDTIDNLGKIIEPLVMAVIGGLFAIIIMGLLLPIYDLVSKVGKG
jgi:general secretion pathway protein F/type IV pilus assembly protein PilC